MKDFTREELTEEYPDIDAIEAIEFCLEQFYADKARLTTDVVVGYLSYEEVIGALLAAEKEIKERRYDEENVRCCKTCDREFTPKFPEQDECVFCWAEVQPRIYGEKLCATCGKRFKPALRWYEDCPECYKQGVRDETN